MPHNIETMFYTGERPWHGLGVELEQPATAKEAIKAAGLEWEVDKSPVFLKGDVEILDRFALVRRDTGHVFNVVQDSYTPVQNREAFNFFDSVVGGGQALYHTAGALGEGERVWILAKLPGVIEPVKGDEVEKFLLLSNSHDGHSAMRMLFTPVRVVCQNTLSQAVSGASGQGISIRHRGDVKMKVAEAQRVLGIAKKFYADFGEVAKALAKFRMTDSSLEAYYNEVLQVRTDAKVSTQTRNVRGELIRLFTEGKGNDRPGVRGSLWTALNAVAEYADYGRVPRGNGDAEKASNRLKSVWFGSGAALKARAWDQALALVKK